MNDCKLCLADCEQKYCETCIKKLKKVFGEKQDLTNPLFPIYGGKNG